MTAEIIVFKIKFTYADTIDITTLAVVSKKGDKKLEFNLPRGLTITADGSLIICDSENHRIQIISCSNKFVRSFGEKGSDLGQFNEPYDIAIRNHNAVIVTDRLNNRVQCFTIDGQFTAILDIADNQFPGACLYQLTNLLSSQLGLVALIRS